MNPDFEIKISCREGSEFDDGTYPEELSCCGYALFTNDGEKTRVLVHGGLSGGAIGLLIAEIHPEFAEALMAGLVQGAYGDEDQRPISHLTWREP